MLCEKNETSSSAACRSRNFCRAATSLPACPACSEHHQNLRFFSGLIKTGQTSSHPDQLDHLVTVGCHATWRCDPARLQDAAKTHGELAVLRYLAISFTNASSLASALATPPCRLTPPGGPLAQTCSCKGRKHLRVNQKSFNRDPHPHRRNYDNERKGVGDNPSEEVSYSITS